MQFSQACLPGVAIWNTARTYLLPRWGHKVLQLNMVPGKPSILMTRSRGTVSWKPFPAVRRGANWRATICETRHCLSSAYGHWMLYYILESNVQGKPLSLLRRPIGRRFEPAYVCGITNAEKATSCSSEALETGMHHFLIYHGTYVVLSPWYLASCLMAEGSARLA
jgi:hypothetical protein